MQKRIFISGAAAGIGRATADAFIEAGWFVGAYDIDSDAVAAWADEQGAVRACAGALDVVDAEQWRNAIAHFESCAGGIDVLVNNAGVLVDGAFADLDIASQRRLIDINVIGVMNGCHAAYHGLAATRGQLINMSSASAFFGQPTLAVYSASKFAVRGLTEALSIEWAPAGIRVCDVMPLFVKTAMVSGMRDVPATRRLGVRLSAQDVAGVILAAANTRRPRLHYCVGWQSRTLKQMLRFSPDWLTGRVNAFIGSH